MRSPVSTVLQQGRIGEQHRRISLHERREGHSSDTRDAQSAIKGILNLW